MPPPTSNPVAAKPTRRFFDPWNSSSTGHQRAENVLSGSTSWRDSRNLKLKSQFTSGLTGGKRLFDTVGAGSENFGKDGRKENGGWEKGASGLRGKGQTTIFEAMGGVKKSSQEEERCKQEYDNFFPTASEKNLVSVKVECATADYDDNTQEDQDTPEPKQAGPQIFRNLTFYINGSTTPYISDHKLKRLICEQGGNLSIALGRRSVTHVILGTPSTRLGGAGGGLAATKIQKEVTRVGGKGVKYVSTEWVVESIKAGKRLPEARFAGDGLKIAAKSQKSVYGLFAAGKG